MSIKRIEGGDRPTPVTAYLPVASLETCKWTRDDMIVEPELHIRIRVYGNTTPALIRLHSRAEANQLIRSLRESRDQVWPKGGG